MSKTHPSPIVEALLITRLIPPSVVSRMVEEGRLDQETVDLLLGSAAADLSSAEVAALLETALREDLHVVVFDPIDDGFRVDADWGAGKVEGRLLGASTLYVRVPETLSEEDVWGVWSGEVLVSMPFSLGITWHLRDPEIVVYNNQRWIKAITK